MDVTNSKIASLSSSTVAKSWKLRVRVTFRSYPCLEIKVVRITDFCVFLVAFLCNIQLFRQRLSHKSVKAYATMPIGIMGRKSLALID